MQNPIKVKTIKLTNNREMPIFGLGTHTSKTQEEMTELLRSAFDNGYRSIDTAKSYLNEVMMGVALQIIFNEGKYKREDIFIATKIQPNKTEVAKEVFASQLKDLQLEYVDLLYIHRPFAIPDDGLKVWNHKPTHQIYAELEEIYNLGWTKGLGVSNFNAMLLVDLLSYCKVKPVVIQIELNVFLQQTRLVEFLKKIQIYPVAQTPLAKASSVINNEELKTIAQKYGASVPQIMLAFLLNQDITVIPKTQNKERLRENLEALNINLKEEDVLKLKTLNTNHRIGDQRAETDFFFKGVPLFD